MFGGSGRIWQEITKRNPKKRLEVLRIDKKQDRSGIYLLGDNRKYIQSLDPGRFDVIDLDAYGVPYEQLAWLFGNIQGRSVMVFVTFIQTAYGRLPNGLLYELGYPKTMVTKCPALFYRHGLEKLTQYLAKMGVKKIKYYSDNTGRKHYLCFLINNKPAERPGKERS